MRLQTPYGEAELRMGFYGNDRVAIQLVDAETEEPVGKLTVNLPEEKLGEGEFFVKTWSENRQIAASCLACGVFEDTGRRVPTGRVQAQVWRFRAGAVPVGAIRYPQPAGEE